MQESRSERGAWWPAPYMVRAGPCTFFFMHHASCRTIDLEDYFCLQDRTLGRLCEAEYTRGQSLPQKTEQQQGTAIGKGCSVERRPSEVSNASISKHLLERDSP